jgi:hypothetical protein
MKLHLQVSTAVLLALVSTAPALSQSKDTQEESGSVSETVTPSKAKRRFFIRNEFRERTDGAQLNILEPLFDLPLTDKLALRTQIPFVSNNALDGGTTVGLGNISNSLYYRYKQGGGKSYFIGLDARWNTGKPKLGAGQTLLAPTWLATISVPKYDTILFPLVQRFFSFDPDAGRKPLNYSVFKFRFLTKLQSRYYTFVEPLIYIDHEDSHDTTGTLEIELGRFVNKQTMVYVRPGAGLWGNTASPYLYDWNFEVGYRYFFK